MRNSQLLFYFVLLFILCSSATVSYGQTWCPPGANWYYGQVTNLGYTGYETITYTGDTIIGTKTCKKLLRDEHGIMYSGPTIMTYVDGTSYTYFDSTSDVVYIYAQNHFDTLYDFHAHPGERWTVPASSRYGNACDSTGIIQVDSIGTMVINSLTLRYICVSPIDSAQDWGMSCKILERIGPIKSMHSSSNPNWWPDWSYLLPVKHDDCGMFIDEGQEGSNFRCYSDLSFSYHPDTTACDYIPNGINELSNPRVINIFPNPSVGSFAVSLKGNGFSTLKIMDALGSELFSEHLNSSQTDMSVQINFTKAPNGIYLLQVVSEKGVLCKRILLQQ